MKQALFVVALLVCVSTCACNQPRTPTAPSQTARIDIAANAIEDVGTRPMSIPPQAIGFPPRNEPNAFFQDLTALYRDTLRRSQSSPTYVDPEGENVWLTEYFRFYLNGCSHQEAMARTLAEITSGGTQPVCGRETPTFPPRNLPFEFQGQLENTYRYVLRRGQIPAYVDTEGANVWLAEYLRYRVSTCGHAEAENKVFTQIRGGGIQPDCTPPPAPPPTPPVPPPAPTPLWSRSGAGNTVFDMPTSISRVHIVGDYAGYCSNFIVHIGGEYIVNEILGSCSSAIGHHYDAIALTIGGVVEIVHSSGVSWSFTEVR